VKSPRQADSQKSQKPKERKKGKGKREKKKKDLRSFGCETGLET
jgi:hypothetical protein